VLAKLNKALSAAMDDPKVARRFAELGYTVAPSGRRSPAYFDEFLHGEVALWKRVLGDTKPAGGN
jgi:hypothetical protein